MAVSATLGAAAAQAEALLVVESDTGKVIHAENATHPWYPASVTKLMTAYLTFSAIKSGRLQFTSLVPVSPNAAAQPPSKMGFKVGTQLTIDNALKMMMVKSANDMAVVLAEGVGGSIDGFAAQMNQAAQRLGMTQTNYVNPNGLPDERQVTSARDLAILARALQHDFAEYSDYWSIPAIKLGRRTIRNVNSLLGRYPGVDGMKTGFICASGFNLVASATRNGKQLIAVVLGAPSAPVRAVKAAQLFERGFNGTNIAWLTPSLGSVESLAPLNVAPTDLREDTCGKHRKRPAAEDVDEEMASSANPVETAAAFLSQGASGAKPSQLLGPVPAVTPIIVYTGPQKTEAQAVAEAAAEPEPKVRARGKKKGIAVAARPKPAPAHEAKHDAKAKPDAKVKVIASEAKPKPAATKQPAKKLATVAATAAKPAAKPAPKPAAASAKPAAKPDAKPKTAASGPTPRATTTPGN